MASPRGVSRSPAPSDGVLCIQRDRVHVCTDRRDQGDRPSRAADKSSHTPWNRPLRFPAAPTPPRCTDPVCPLRPANFCNARFHCLKCREFQGAPEAFLPTPPPPFFLPADSINHVARTTRLIQRRLASRTTSHLSGDDCEIQIAISANRLRSAASLFRD